MTTEYSGSGDLDKSLELLWGMRERPARGPKPGLSLERIVDAAIEVADADGLAALSMRRVAATLGVGTMSLYRYVPGKSELLDLMLDRVVGTGDDLRSSDDASWREVLETVARGIWQLCVEHPWYPLVDQTRPLLGPNNLAGLDYVMGRLTRSALSDRDAIMVLGVVDGFVTAVARGRVNGLLAEQRTGLTDEEFWAAQEPVLIKAMETGAFPAMAQLDENTFNFSHEQLFEFGLERLLDGLEAYVTR